MPGLPSRATAPVQTSPPDTGRGRAFLKAETMTKPTEEQIRARAHELWEQNHRPDGRDEEFWHQAERQLQGEEELKGMPEDF
jgi:hypothetical protein